MSNHSEEIKVKLTNQKVQFTGVSKNNPGRPIKFDYYPPIGDGQGYNGLELLLMSLAGCLGTTVVYLLRQMGKNISGLDIEAKGTRRTQPPIKFEKIDLQFHLNSPDTDAAEIQKAIHLAEESVCPVWQMIKNNVEVVPSYNIISN
jgi:putative redox protein